jgi:hypothetical protein
MKCLEYSTVYTLRFLILQRDSSYLAEIVDCSCESAHRAYINAPRFLVFPQLSHWPVELDDSHPLRRPAGELALLRRCILSLFARAVRYSSPDLHIFSMAGRTS